MSFLQRYLRHILVVSQCFGILPLYGIYSENPKYLRFTWRSWRVCYTICLTVCTFFSLTMGLYHFWISDFQLANLTTIFFYLNGFSVILLFLKLATKWPDFMQYWQDTEVFIRCKIILPNRYSYVLFLIIGAAIVEHTLLITYSMTAEEYKKYQTNNTTRFEHFLARDSHIFKHISYTWYMGTFVKVISLANTFYWNFMDVFIIAMSIALAAMLKLINYRIRAARQVRAIIWTDLRRNYDRICELSFRVEDIMSPLILTSFASNLYFILVQLHGSVKKRRATMESVYFFFSFGFLLIRTLAVCLFAANIDDEHQTSVKLLSCLQSYNAESKRLFQQITSIKLALTGLNFFTVTRGLVLNIAAAIVTYEIFFIQYINTITDDD